ALYRLGEYGRDGEIAYLAALGLVLRIGDGVEEDELLDGALLYPLKGGAGEHAVRGAGIYLLRAADVHEGVRRVAEAARGIDHVVEQDDVLAAHVAYYIHDLGGICLLAALVNDGERHIQLLREGAG